MAVKIFVSFCSICGLLLFFSIRITGGNPKIVMVRDWAHRIGDGASNFTDELTGAKYLQQIYENLTFLPADVNGREVLIRMKTEMENFFSSKTSSLKKLVEKAEDSYCKYKYNKNLQLGNIDYPNAKDLEKYLNTSGLRLEHSTTFQSEVSFNKSMIHVPTDVYDGAAEIVNGIQWTSSLDGVFDRNSHDDPTSSWQYFGSDKGFMRVYPAKPWDTSPSQVDLFDARRRPWYIQGATSPKNVIILIDASGSMHGVPMRIAKLSAQNLIDTLGDNDFFNVVYFNKAAYVLCCSESGPTLLQATRKNKMYVKNKLQEIVDREVAMWKLGMSKAFELLQEANKGASCQQAIMVLSDGTTSSLSDLFEEQNLDKKVRIFTFAVGPPAESTEALRKMACNNKGYFTRIQSVGAVREVSENYIRALTRPMAMAPKENITGHTVWTSVYADALGLGLMVTGTLPVFHRIKDSSNCAAKDGMEQEERTKDHFLGVMATDVPLGYLQGFLLRPLVGPSGYIFAVDNNGMIIFHPRLEMVHGYLQDPLGVELTYVESAKNNSNVLELRKAIIDTVPVSDSPHGSGIKSQSFEGYHLSVDQVRVMKHTLNYYFDGLKGTSFSLVVATPQLGYKYNLTGYTDHDVITELHDLLSKENDISVERWPYCKNVMTAQTSPLEALIHSTQSGDATLCNNSELLSGLLVDVNATSNMPAVWKQNSISPGVKEVFVRTFWGLTRYLSLQQNKLGYSSQGDFLGSVFASQIPNTSVVFSSPYLAAKSEKNTTSVFAYKRIYRNHRPAAVLGYEMDMDKLTRDIFVENTKCTGGDCESVPDCDRTGKNDFEGLFCYLLDENGFVVAGNDGSSAGKFFGRVDAPVMQTLIRQDENSTSGVYNKVVLTDYQALCEEKSGVNSRGTSFLLKPLLSLSAYTEWWTTKAVWSLLYFNLYSWIFSENEAVTEATDDVPKNISCVKRLTTYYSTKENISEEGTTTCNDCVRRHALSSVPNTNLLLVVIEGTGCGPCSQSVRGMAIPGEPTEISSEPEPVCKEPEYRRRPKRCFVSTNSETGYMCGDSSLTRPSLQVMSVHFLFIFTLWQMIGLF
ncbi:unnamed protein product [Porites evermanni]|uniref:VWFA domain-containing protein n=1 Tax=Porites evermanni TaxID=104178 RepID=A0ABN8RPW2_9CNID|nr:unnamed protein product [Porites evermanni]